MDIPYTPTTSLQLLFVLRKKHKPKTSHNPTSQRHIFRAPMLIFLRTYVNHTLMCTSSLSNYLNQPYRIPQTGPPASEWELSSTRFETKLTIRTWLRRRHASSQSPPPRSFRTTRICSASYAGWLIESRHSCKFTVHWQEKLLPSRKASTTEWQY